MSFTSSYNISSWLSERVDYYSKDFFCKSNSTSSKNYRDLSRRLMSTWLILGSLFSIFLKFCYYLTSWFSFSWFKEVLLMIFSIKMWVGSSKSIYWELLISMEESENYSEIELSSGLNLIRERTMLISSFGGLLTWIIISSWWKLRARFKTRTINISFWILILTDS